MGKAIIISMILATSGCSVLAPWVGIIAYYLLAVLGPQYIWWWDFDGVRASFYIALFTLAGVALSAVSKKFAPALLKTRMNLLVLMLWIFVSLSYLCGPYVAAFKGPGLSPEQLFSISNSIFLFYFCASLVLSDVGKLRILSLVLVLSTLYLVYWANLQYFSANYSHFNYGRLKGPEGLDGSSIYRDENVFAMLFVTGLPFLYYFGKESSRNWLRYGLWCSIPFCWHAIFLTGSRGGLLGLGAIMVVCALQTRRRFVALGFLLCFVLFYQWQAGDVMKERSDTISGYQGEGSAEMRLTAWKGGVRMVLEHPLTGVGLGSFITALPEFVESTPRVAHNTLVQYSAESGLGAGVCYSMIIILFLRNSSKIKRWCRSHPDAANARTINSLNDASVASFIGLVICSFFLTLNNYEVFFVLLLINNGLSGLVLPVPAASPAVIGCFGQRCTK